MVRILDCDVTAGFWPKARVPMRPEEVADLLAGRGITEACVVSARGIFFDFKAGNREALRWAEESRGRSVRFRPVGTIDLRRYLGWREEIREMTRAGVRLWRLFPEHQGWALDHPGLGHIARALEEEGAVLFMKGRPGPIVKALGGSKVSLLIGTHFYDLAEALALWEQGAEFAVTTQLLHGPGTIGLVRGLRGAGGLVFGSGAPLSAPGSALAVLEAAGLGPEDRERVLRGNLAALLGPES